MFGSVLNKLLGKSGGAASRLASEYGDDVLRGVTTEYGDDAARGVLSSLGDAVSSGAKKSKIGDALVRASDAGLNAPLSLSKKDMRDIGSDASEKIGKLFDRTGMSNIEDLRSFAKELTGGENSYLDEVTNAMRTNLGTGNAVDLNDLGPQLRDVRDSISDKLVAKTFDEADPVKKANMLRGMADDLSKSATKTEGSTAKSKALSDLGREIDARIDAGVNPKYVSEAYDNTGEEFLHRSQEAFQAGDKSKAEAYKRLAQEFIETPPEERTIANFRSSKKDFVDLSEIGKLNDRTKGGGSISRAVKGVPVVEPVVNALVAQPMERGAQKIGEVTRKIGRAFQNGTAQENLKKAAAVGAGGLGLLAAASGGNDKNKKTGDVLEGSDYTENTANALGGAQTGATDKISNVGSSMGNMAKETTIGGYTRSQLEDAYVKALMANDPKSAQAIGSIIDMADKKEARAISAAKTNKNNATSKADAKKEAGLNTLNTLLKTYEKGGGGQGVIGGTLTNLLNTATGGNWNPAAQTYATQSRGAAAQIIKALGESGQLSDRDMQSAMDMLPKNTDSDKVAKEKVSNLMSLLRG